MPSFEAMSDHYIGDYPANATSQLALCSDSGTPMSFCCLAPGEDPSYSCACMSGGPDQPVVVYELVATVTVVATTTSGTSTIVIQPVETTTLTGGQPRATGSTSSPPPPAGGATNKAALSSPPQSAIVPTSSATEATSSYFPSAPSLSTGMIAGISAGSATFVLVIASVGIIMRRLKKKRQPPEFKAFVDDNSYTPEASLVKDAAAIRPKAPRPPPLALSRPPAPKKPLPPPPPPPPPDQYPHQKNPRYTQQSRCELEAISAPVYELSGMPTPGLSPSAFTEVPVMLYLPDDR